VWVWWLGMSGLGVGLKRMGRSELEPVGWAAMVWTQAEPVEAMRRVVECPAIRLEIWASGVTMCQPEPGSCWSWTVGPVKGSKPQSPLMVPVSWMGFGVESTFGLESAVQASFDAASESPDVGHPFPFGSEAVVGAAPEFARLGWAKGLGSVEWSGVG